LQVWDQGERDVHCFAPATNHTARYPCLERQLIKTWRAGFESDFAFVAVQLPGYIGDCDATGANPDASYYNCVPGVFDMRLAQEMGVSSEQHAAVVATYDLSCPFGVKTPQCPYGSVHNVNKTIITERVVAQLIRLLKIQPSLITEGPRAVKVSAVQDGAANVSAVQDGETTDPTTWLIRVEFNGGTGPLLQVGTQYCVHCCTRSPGNDTADFDASADGGLTYVNGTTPQLAESGTSVTFSVSMPTKPTHVRYTANQGFPQCAVYNQEGYPAFPFVLAVDGTRQVGTKP
jgi:hypothetical protein